MSVLLGNLVFLNPLILWGLAVLPALWFLLRITPPAPKLIILPTTRFLAGLIPEKQTSSHTPWWILLLRMIIAALVIIALARPVYNPAEGLAGNGPVQIVIDNGWASAPVWDSEIRAALDLTAQAGRENRDIYILTTAPGPDGKPLAQGPLAAGQAEAIIKGLEPQPWPADYNAAAELINDAAKETVWFAHGIDEGGIADFAAALREHGNVTYVSPTPEHLPLLLGRDEQAEGFQITITAPETITANRPVTVQALSLDGSVLDQVNIAIDPAALPAKIKFDLPEAVRGDVGRFRIGGAPGAGGITLLDESSRKRSVGLVGPADDEDTKPFIEARYYLKRAIEPFAELFQGNIPEILKHEPSVIILPDIAAMATDDLNALEGWVKDGGLLLRFAGPVMAKSQGEPFLVPVPLRLGGRSMDGSLTWEKPAKLQPFSETSPFYGIEIHEEIPVRQQILAQPTEDIDERTWARLEDGTPLITAAPLGKGLLVMIHTTAAPDWSDLPLSGAFVEILQRIVNMTGNPQGSLKKTDGFLHPLWVLDGFGTLKKPAPTMASISAAEFSKIKPGPEHPPGIYANEGYQRALNLGDHIKNLDAASLPANVSVRNYGVDYERDLMPSLLYMALILILADWILMTVLMSGFRAITKLASVALILFFAIPAQAQSERDIEYANGFYLAFIKSGDMALDAASQRGLENLGKILTSRTSIEPSGVAALDPEYDELVFFPLIYWPVSTAQTPLSDKAIKSIQNYLDHGGTILFDTRDRSYGSGTLSSSANANALRTLTASLNIPPLEPMAKDHVLNRSFYLLNPVRSGYDPGTIWAETNVSGRDGVSSVLIGSHDWASAWSGESAGRMQDMEYRFGVNLVMYALTGNYKADQVHIPHILERLGE
ncbi:MAG TPA: DUF4159 domain-containing protein [Alphaproteobacteria bacterium]|nr:DUF4159 domain-containing protein [Micavibrio sp.]HQX27486.1 DUF4159 domain-containing protein [Alphaproteobacteria bacterium]